MVPQKCPKHSEAKWKEKQNEASLICLWQKFNSTQSKHKENELLSITRSLRTRRSNAQI